MQSLIYRSTLVCLISALSGVAHAEDAPSESTASEGEAVQASPDVQAQVGVGTEKEKEADKPAGKPKPADPATPFDPTVGPQEEDMGHAMQFGFRPGLVIPYRVTFRFDDSPQCDLDGDGVGDLNNDGQDQKTCGYVMSPQLELAASFTPLDSVEPYAWLRLGLGQEAETGTDSALLFGVGVRLYTMPTSQFKLFFDVAAGLETEGAIDPADAENYNYGTQAFGRLGFGPQFDINRYFGAFLVIGPGFAVPRGITMQLEGLVGLQGRLP